MATEEEIEAGDSPRSEVNRDVTTEEEVVVGEGPCDHRDDDPACPRDCEVCCQLPYNKDTGVLEVHHYLAKTGLWNEEKRFDCCLLLSPEDTILYVGGNTDGADGKVFMTKCPLW